MVGGDDGKINGTIRGTNRSGSRQRTTHSCPRITFTFSFFWDVSPKFSSCRSLLYILYMKRCHLNPVSNGDFLFFIYSPLKLMADEPTFSSVTVRKSFWNSSVKHHAGYLLASNMSLMQPASNSSVATSVSVVTASPSLHLKPTRSFLGRRHCFHDGIKRLISHASGPDGRGLQVQKDKNGNFLSPK